MLPHGTKMCSLILHPDEQLRMSCRYLGNFFCSLRLPYAKVCRNAVGTAISPNQVEEIGFEVPPHLRERKAVYVALTSLDMGDVNALGHAQQAHEVMLGAGGAAAQWELLRYGHPIPSGSCHAGSYVDDLAVVQIHKVDEHPDCDVRLLEKAEAGYSAAGATVKHFKDANQAFRATIWGTEVDGIEGLASTPLKKLVQLQWISLDWLGQRTDYLTFAALLGSWNAALMHCRCLMALKFSKSLKLSCRSWSVRSVFSESQPEFLMSLALVVMTPMMHSDLRAELSEELFLTDASLWKAGVTRAHIPKSAGEELWRFADLRGRHSWLAPVHMKGSDELERSLSLVEAKFAELVHGADHEAMIRYPFQTSDHITLKEGLLYKTLATMIGADPSRHGKRFVNGFDSMAVKGAVAKGRSSSHRLNCILKQALPHRIGSGCQLGTSPLMISQGMCHSGRALDCRRGSLGSVRPRREKLCSPTTPASPTSSTSVQSSRLCTRRREDLQR